MNLDLEQAGRELQQVGNRWSRSKISLSFG